MKRVAIYARVSTNNGTQDYQRQIDDLKKIIYALGYTDDQIDIFAEKISGYTKKDERIELKRMLSIIESDNHYYETIFCTEVSRLGRNPRETRETIDMLTDYCVPIYIQSLGRATLDVNGKRDFIINIVLQVLLEFANAESEQMKSRSRSGLLRSASSGKAGGSKHLPYGYTKDSDKMLIVDHEEAVIVREVFQMYLQGSGATVISNILNSRNIPTRYNKSYAGQTIHFNIKKSADTIKWSDKTVLDILSNPLYKGKRRFKGQLFTAPAIVSEELFDKCQDLRNDKTHTHYLTSYTYLLKDLIHCGCCSRNYYARYKPALEGDKVYVCSSSIGNNSRCENRGMNIMLLETAIYDQLLKSDAVLKYISNGHQIKKQLENDIQVLNYQLESETSLLVPRQSEKDRLLKIYLSGAIDEETFTTQNETIKNQITANENRIKIIEKDLKLKKKSLSKHTGETATRKMLQEAAYNRSELQIIFRQLIHKVIINDLNQRFILATIYIQVDGVVLKNPLLIVIDKISIRKKELKYICFNGLENQPVYNSNNILQNDKGDILFEVQHEFENKGWTVVKELLQVEPKEEQEEKIIAA